MIIKAIKIEIEKLNLNESFLLGGLKSQKSSTLFAGLFIMASFYSTLKRVHVTQDVVGSSKEKTHKNLFIRLLGCSQLIVIV